VKWTPDMDRYLIDNQAMTAKKQADRINALFNTHITDEAVYGRRKVLRLTKRFKRSR
jgi:hypothetical protein